MSENALSLAWLEPDDAFPPVHHAWGHSSDAPGLLCAGGDLSVDSLVRAYRAGIFPWFSPGQPILWWSPDPRMVLNPAAFRLHTSLRKTLKKFAHSPHCEIRVDYAFETVIQACADSGRGGQSGTWIVPTMVQAYVALHRAGLAHSVETWVHGELVGGLYFVAIGRAVFGESMFHRVTDASKIALAALIALCRHAGVPQIDCQQNTRHLASFGAAETPRTTFVQAVTETLRQPAPDWRFSPLYWNGLLTPAAANT
ncbi:leucyl/phenylalanyl-tRNA--protein transferase [Rhodoferax sp. BLA1]|uniref:leucyl/phenylalanyl-tRNA--protein transferase n=1 Tax=Rhodoferax sp. BLA1 TaxID=2576062 RepID=UPI0015D44413|nr:leucyl/phenylalanyl-tRNA--protein transferase [Rhodoferax sp. BLA1]